MYKNVATAVVIPAFCEESRIQGVLAGVPAWVDHIVVVDDASTDQTYEMAKRFDDPRLVVERHTQNQGVGRATLTGWSKAMELGARILVKMDADGQMDPGVLPVLIDPIRRAEADYVKGNRFLHARKLAQMPWSRRIGNICLSFMAKLASGYWPVFDPTNGYVAIDAAVIPLLDQAHIHPRFFFENSMLLELGLNRAVVRDVYIPARYGDKISHLSQGRALLEFPPLLLRGFIRRMVLQYFVRDFTAASLFFMAGFVSSVFGLWWGIYHWWASAQAGVATPTGTVMIAVLPLMLGLQLVLQALVMDVQNVPREPLQSRLRAES